MEAFPPPTYKSPVAIVVVVAAVLPAAAALPTADVFFQMFLFLLLLLAISTLPLSLLLSFLLLLWDILLGDRGYLLLPFPHDTLPITVAIGGLDGLIFLHCFRCSYCCWKRLWRRILTEACLKQMPRGATRPAVGSTLLHYHKNSFILANQYVGDVQKVFAGYCHLKNTVPGIYY